MTKKAKKIIVYLILLVILSIATPIIYTNATAPDGDVKFHMLNVGAADCLVLELPDDKVMMVDCGYGSGYSFSTIDNYLKQIGITTIDYAINTHPDSDHYNGYTKLFEFYEILEIYLPPTENFNTTSTYDKFVEAAFKETNNIKYNEQGLTIVGADYLFTFHTPIAELLTGSNTMSAIITFEYNNKVLVLTGDAEKATQDVFMQSWTKTNATVYLKVAHHGTDTIGSNNEEFIEFLKPKYAFVSCGKGYPRQTVVARLYMCERIYITLNDGNVVVAL